MSLPRALLLGGIALASMGASCVLEFNDYPVGEGGGATGGEGGEAAGGEAEGGAANGGGADGGGGAGPALCGDGAVHPEEACDDGDTEPGDGCSDRCEIEEGFACDGEPSLCTTPTIVALGRDGNFYRFDADGVATLVGATGFTDVASLAASPANELFTAESSSGASPRRLIRIDPETGVGTEIASLNNPVELNFGALAFSPSGVLYGVNTKDDALYTIEVETGAATRVGATGLATVHSLDFTEAGQLYAWNNAFDIWPPPLKGRLNRVDPETGASTAAPGGPNLFPQILLESLATMPGDATFIALGATNLMAIDRLSGAVQVIGPHGIREAAGVEVLPLPALPPEGPP